LSREYRGRRIVLWPINIDSTATRGEGRKIPLRYAVRRPRVEEIVEAAKLLGLNPVVEDARYPRRWWEQRQRIVVDKLGSKLRTLIEIAKAVNELREKRKRHSQSS
jgi:signal recognition particle subunit SRP19